MKKNVLFALGAVVALGLSGTLLSSCGDDNESEIIIPVPTEEYVYEGTTVTYPDDKEDEAYSSKKSTYSIAYDETKKTATLTITDADFIQGMPALGAMTFPDLDWRVDESVEGIAFYKNALSPEIGGRPFQMFPITRLEGIEKPGESLYVTFVCTKENKETKESVAYTVTFTGTLQK